MESVLQNLIRQRAESSRQTSRSNYSLSAICSVMFLCLLTGTVIYMIHSNTAMILVIKISQLIQVSP